MEKIRMLQRFRARYRSLLGVDISPTSVKVLEVSFYRSRLSIEGYGYLHLPGNNFDLNKEKIISSIKILLTQIHASTKSVAIAVPDSAVISKTIQLADSLNEREMEEIIFLEAERHLSYPASKLNLDFVLRGPNKNFLGRVDVQLLAAREDKVSRRVEIIKESGLDVKLVDVESNALACVIEQFFPRDIQNQLVALIQINYKSIKLFVYEKGETVYCQEDDFDINEHKALHLIDKSIVNDEEVFTYFVDIVLAQIKKSIHYYFSTSQHKFFEQLFLFGEISVLDELAKKVQVLTGSPTRVINPFESLSFSNKINGDEFTKQAPLFLIAFGLALRLKNDR